MEENYNCPDNVYAPREDSYLLAQYAKKYSNVTNALDMGSGSGVVSIAMAKKAKNVFACDVNFSAARCTDENAKKHNCSNIFSFAGDLFTAVNCRFDLITFNLPYLPVLEEERSGTDLEKAWDGGPSGREVMYKFIESLQQYLSPQGCCLILISSLTGLLESQDYIKSQGFSASILGLEHYAFETLYVIKIEKNE